MKQILTLVVAGCLALPVVAQEQTQDLAQDDQFRGHGIDCFCTDSTGERVELGQEICLIVGGRSFMARCEMSLNNPMWREQSEGCVSS